MTILGTSVPQLVECACPCIEARLLVQWPKARVRPVALCCMSSPHFLLLLKLSYRIKPWKAKEILCTFFLSFFLLSTHGWACPPTDAFDFAATVKILSFQINFESQGFWKLKLCQSHLFYFILFIYFFSCFLTFKANLQLLQLFMRMLQRCFAVNLPHLSFHWHGRGVDNNWMFFFGGDPWLFWECFFGGFNKTECY